MQHINPKENDDAHAYDRFPEFFSDTLTEDRRPKSDLFFLGWHWWDVVVYGEFAVWRQFKSINS